MENSDTIVCDHCRRPISASNHTVHVTHCSRHLALCELCGEPVPRTEMEEHRRSLHTKLECTLCGQPVFSGLMDNHKEDACPGRAVTCPYCELSMPYSSLEEHESYCGSRTEVCPACHVRVMYRHWPLHVESGHTLTRPERPPSPPKAGSDRSATRPAAGEHSLYDDDHALDERLASFVRKPVDEIVEDTMETWRKRRELRRFEDDCFEQAMLMAIELSKTSAAAASEPPVSCPHCSLSLPADEFQLHQDTCPGEQRTHDHRLPPPPRKSALRRSPAEAPRWAARPVQDTPPDDDDVIALPCEFCDSAFSDSDLLRHQLRCEKNPQRLDLPAVPTVRSHSRHSALTSTPPANGDSQALSDLDGPDYYRRHSAALASTWRQQVEADLNNDDALARRWSMLNIGDATPEKPHRSKSKHKKRVNFLGHDDIIQPETEYVPEGKEEKKKKKKHKEHKKKSSKKHRAPEPPVDTAPSGLLHCEY